jgi:predicted ATPase/class 3 adenylate cyclase
MVLWCSRCVGAIMLGVAGMAALPSGTVTLLFSDIEGSTLLLSRLGERYAVVLDVHGRVLRAVWARWGGRELGTEGDSFFVVFGAASDAVGAALEAQQNLAAQQFPGGERVRVRIGVHTGEPVLHGGSYVGMDVHRAARVAAIAHGGQVLLTETTSAVVARRLPAGAALVDLGWHRLKDLAAAEHLFQLSAPGLDDGFPRLTGLGAATSLPVPLTRLVGRVAELAALSGLVSSSGVRLVTLTGPGGSGKTRLAIGLAERLVEGFPDGVYFVPLAAVNTSEVMWTSMAEVLDVRPRGRTTAGLVNHLAHRRALLVLDNVEQLTGADRVVSELLSAASQAVVITTSRRPLHLAGEHEFPVPPLDLTGEVNLEQAEHSGAVQLFVQHAQMVRPSFTLTVENAPEVLEVCRRLDGLPLAIELAAARTKVLSPAALLARLDHGLDLKDTGVDRPVRHRSLRDTVAWSHDLLTAPQQVFFRRLGVFAGGADLAAAAAVTGADPADALEMVTDLVDASLVTIVDGFDGQPRVGTLETIRAYAQDRLRTAGELNSLGRLHAERYLTVTQVLSALLRSGDVERLPRIRRQFEVEHDNFRAALTWALQPEDLLVNSSDRTQIGLRLCSALAGPWRDGGYLAEARLWLERASSMGDNRVSAELGECLSELAEIARSQGELGYAHQSVTRAVSMLRELGEKQRLSYALRVLARCVQDNGDLESARQPAEEAVSLAREVGDKDLLGEALTTLAILESDRRKLERSLELFGSAVAIKGELGQDYELLILHHFIACDLRLMGRLDEAHRLMHRQLPQLLRLADQELLTNVAEDYAALIAEVGEHEPVARLLGSADAWRERYGAPRRLTKRRQIENAIGAARAAMGAETWDREYQRGHRMTLYEALTSA